MRRNPLLLGDALLLDVLLHTLFRRAHHGAERFRSRMERLRLRPYAHNAHALHYIALRDLHHYIHPLHHVAEHRVIAIEVRAVSQRDAELRRIRVRTAIRHIECSRVIVTQPRVDLVWKHVARPLGAIRLGNPGLDHMSRNHAMINRPIEERPPRIERRIRDSPLRQPDKISDGHWRKLRLQPRHNQPLGSPDLRIDSVRPLRRSYARQQRNRRHPQVG